MRIIRGLTVIVVVALCMTSACEKKERGCMKEGAANYNPEAEREDNACVYQRTFWAQNEDDGWVDVWVATADTAGAPLTREGRVTEFYPEDPPKCEGASGTVEVIREPGDYDYETENEKGHITLDIVRFRENDICRLWEVF